MRNDPYRHSVWIDVFGAVLFGAVLLGGAGYLLFHAESATSGLAVETAPQRGSWSAVRGAGPSPSPSRSSRRRGRRSSSRPLLSRRTDRAPSGGEVPFSKSWRSEATPSLAGPSSPGGEGQGGSGGSASSRSGPAIGSARPTARGSRYGAGAGASERRAGSQWRAEARRLSGRARALSNQLGQMARSSEESGEETTRKQATGQASGAAASSDDRNVGDPPSVPIDDHLHWLLIAGLLWGVWRLWRGM